MALKYSWGKSSARGSRLIHVTHGFEISSFRGEVGLSLFPLLRRERDASIGWKFIYLSFFFLLSLWSDIAGNHDAVYIVMSPKSGVFEPYDRDCESKEI
jgi:hypothetical protein